MTASAMIPIKTSQEYASLVPELSTEEYESLKQSIKQNGLWVPIIVNSQGVILDGHHRYKACQELGINEPKTETIEKEFKDKLEETLFVIDCNLTRRHLNNFQKTELALKSKSILEEIAKKNMSLGGKGVPIGTPLGRIDEEIGKRAGVGKNTVRRVQEIEDKAPEEIKQKLRTGQMSINEAFEEMHKEEYWNQIEKEGELLHDKIDKAEKERDKAEKELDEYSHRDRPTKAEIAKMSVEEREAPIRYHVELLGKWINKDVDVWKAIAAMKFFVEYRYSQNNDIESVASQTLKELEEWNYNNEDKIPIRGCQCLEKMLYFAAAENNIDSAKIKNSKMIQMQLQLLKKRERESEVMELDE